MSELPQTPSDTSSDEQMGKIFDVDFSAVRNSPDYLEPDELDDSEVVDLFLSQLSHPGANRRSDELGEYVQRILGDRVASDLNQQESDWHTRMRMLMLDIDGLHPDEIDTLLSIDSVLRSLEEALKTTRDRANQMQQERKALRLLREFRAGITMSGTETSYDNDKWEDLIKRLVNN